MTPVLAALALACALLGGTLLVVFAKNRPFAKGDVFRASRLSRGNRLFPTQVAVTDTSVIHHTPQWVGHREESIAIGQVASVTVDTGLLFSDVIIETTGGSAPIVCHGHHKGDAVRMKHLIERQQAARGPQAGATKVCPFCAESIKAEAIVCRYCGRDLPKG